MRATWEPRAGRILTLVGTRSTDVPPRPILGSCSPAFHNEKSGTEWNLSGIRPYQLLGDASKRGCRTPIFC
jgi:hypothetical protein